MARAAGTALAPVAPVEIGYPSSDGEPVAESAFQLIPLFYAFDALRRRYAGRRAEQELRLESAARRRAEPITGPMRPRSTQSLWHPAS